MRCVFRGCGKRAKENTDCCSSHFCKVCHSKKGGYAYTFPVSIKKVHYSSNNYSTICGHNIKTEFCKIGFCEKPMFGEDLCFDHYIISCICCRKKILNEKNQRCKKCLTLNIYKCQLCINMYRSKFIVKENDMYNRFCNKCFYKNALTLTGDVGEIPLHVYNNEILLNYDFDYTFMHYLYDLYSHKAPTGTDLNLLFKLPRDIFYYIIKLTQSPPYLVPLKTFISNKNCKLLCQ
jgi:hypothetical protein